MAIVRYRVYDSRIQGLFIPGGDAYKYQRDLAYNIKDVAVVIAPSRTNTLRRQHRVTNTGVRPFGTYIGVINYSEHAAFVHDGTTGPITARGDRLMKMRPSPHSLFPAPTLHVAVRGQVGNPWLARAAKLVLSRR